MEKIDINEQVDEVCNVVWSLTPGEGLFGPWFEQFKDHNFSQAVQLLEQYFTDEKVSDEARLWWILCQSKLNLVPATALSAPLIENLQKTVLSQTHLDLICCLLVILSRQLEERNHFRLASNLLEKASGYLLKSESFNLQQKQAVKEFWLLTMEEEISRAETRREDRKYITSLRDKISEVQPMPVFDIVKSTQGVEQIEAIQQKGFSFTKVVFLLIGLLTVLVGAFVFYLKHYNRLFNDDRLVMVTEPSSSSTAILPTLSPSSSVDLEGRENNSDEIFEKLKKRLDRLSDLKAAEVEQVVNKTEETSTQDQVLENETPLKVEAKTPIAALPEPIPSLPIEEQQQIASQQVVHVGKTGNLYQIPVTPEDLVSKESTLEQKQNSGTLSQNGVKNTEQVHGYEVRHFPAPVIYRVIVNSKVLDSPSLLANSVAHLEVGSKVQAVAQVGRWLEIRSVKGNRGYLYTQNAVLELEERE